ncbi:ATP-binding protein [Neolewinella agarilytica]|uniref:ATP-binding protein n=1 Tax=Neolewinella agarilytica TaxID=478744 RepID=UPI00235753C2|nr:ATP-binding protein [Neolewinella agarilytica]
MKNQPTYVNFLLLVFLLFLVAIGPELIGGEIKSFLDSLLGKKSSFWISLILFLVLTSYFAWKNSKAKKPGLTSEVAFNQAMRKGIDKFYKNHGGLILKREISYANHLGFTYSNIDLKGKLSIIEFGNRINKSNITLVGEQGIGKTWFMLDMARELADKFNNNVVYFDIRKISDQYESLEQYITEYVQNHYDYKLSKIPKDIILFIDGFDDVKDKECAIKLINCIDIRYFISGRKSSLDYIKHIKSEVVISLKPLSRSNILQSLKKGENVSYDNNRLIVLCRSYPNLAKALSIPLYLFMAKKLSDNNSFFGNEYFEDKKPTHKIIRKDLLYEYCRFVIDKIQSLNSRNSFYFSLLIIACVRSNTRVIDNTVVTQLFSVNNKIIPLFEAIGAGNAFIRFTGNFILSISFLRIISYFIEHSILDALFNSVKFSLVVVLCVIGFYVLFVFSYYANSYVSTLIGKYLFKDINEASYKDIQIEKNYQLEFRWSKFWNHLKNLGPKLYIISMVIFSTIILLLFIPENELADLSFLMMLKPLLIVFLMSTIMSVITVGFIFKFMSNVRVYDKMPKNLFDGLKPDSQIRFKHFNLILNMLGYAPRNWNKLFMQLSEIGLLIPLFDEYIFRHQVMFSFYENNITSSLPRTGGEILELNSPRGDLTKT